MADQQVQAPHSGAGEPLTHVGNEPDSTKCQNTCVGALASSPTILEVPHVQSRMQKGVTRVSLGCCLCSGRGEPGYCCSPSECSFFECSRPVLRVLGQVFKSNSPASGSHDLENAGAVQFSTPAGGGITGTPGTRGEALECLPQGRMLFICGTIPGHDDNTRQGPVVNDTETVERIPLEFDALSEQRFFEEEREEIEEDQEEESIYRSYPGDYGMPLEFNTLSEQRFFDEEWEGIEEDQEDESIYLSYPDDYVDGRDFEQLSEQMGENPLDLSSPGDYVDARMQQLLQETFENDSPRGAPPAARVAIDCLPLTPIGQRHLDDGSAKCIICLEIVALGESATQMPCSHLYHNECILPWLSKYNNSCPVCPYELPTNDPEYEEQKLSRK